MSYEKKYGNKHNRRSSPKDISPKEGGYWWDFFFFSLSFSTPPWAVTLLWLWFFVGRLQNASNLPNIYHFLTDSGFFFYGRPAGRSVCPAASGSVFLSLSLTREVAQSVGQEYIGLVGSWMVAKTAANHSKKREIYLRILWIWLYTIRGGFWWNRRMWAVR